MLLHLSVGKRYRQLLEILGDHIDGFNESRRQISSGVIKNADESTSVI